MEKIENIIGNYPFFCGMDKKHLKILADCAKFVTFKPGTLICEDNEDAGHFYLLMDGRVAVELYEPPRGGLLIQTLETGDVLGWSWLVPPYKWRFNARTTATTRVIA